MAPPVVGIVVDHVERNSCKILPGAATILAAMEEIGQSAATGNGLQSPFDWPALLARHERWLRTAVLAQVQEPDGVEEVMQAVAVAAMQQLQKSLGEQKQQAPAEKK